MLAQVAPTVGTIRQTIFSAAVPLRPIRTTMRAPLQSIFRASGAMAAGSAAIQLQQQRAYQLAEERQKAAGEGIVELHVQCRTLLTIVGSLAVWAYLSAGASSAGPFASLTASLTTMGPGGPNELAARSAWTGLATGVFHTLCGPDHLAGLAPLSIGRGRLAAAALGTLWGFGHSTGQLILGLVFALLKDKFHDLMPFLDKWAAYIVPLTLITIGVVGIYESHFAKDDNHGADGHLEELAKIEANKKEGKRVGFTTYFTGIVHGLQPDALYVVIPALALPTKLAAICFISMFVIGTCLSMGGYTLLIGTTSKALIKEQPWLQSHLSSVACGFAILCGILMLLAGQGVAVPLFS